jgi:GTP-sensing pleiotropic transcriptional regulator CodY
MGEPMNRSTMPYDQRDTDTGQFSATFSDEEFLDAVEDSDLPTTSGVADTVGCEYRTAYERLGQLEDAGAVDSRKVGNSLVWMLADE